MAFEKKPKPLNSQMPEKINQAEQTENLQQLSKDKAAGFEPDGGLYKNVNVPVSWLNIAVIGGLALLVLLVWFGLQNPGYDVIYNSRGGSDVESQIYKYQEPLVFPKQPERMGYSFLGWSLDEEGIQMVEEGTPVETDMELYAEWEIYGVKNK